MSVIFSRQCEYALQAILYIAAKRSKEYTDIKEVSSKLKIPHHFLAKILQNLSKVGILKSQKGPSGGFSLNKNVDQITLYNIVSAIDGDSMLKDCVLGLPSCDDNEPCPIHHQWAAVRGDIYEMLAGNTIGQIVARMKRKPKVSGKMSVV